MADTKNLCAQIPLTLHDRVCTEKDQAGLTTAQYITNLLTEYYQMKENGGNMNMANNGSRTMAFQIPEELFQRIKAHLDWESLRLGRKYTQREFVLGLIEEALTAAENTCQPQEDTEDTQQPQEDTEDTQQPQEDTEDTQQPQEDGENACQPQEDTEDTQQPQVDSEDAYQPQEDGENAQQPQEDGENACQSDEDGITETAE